MQRRERQHDESDGGDRDQPVHACPSPNETCAGDHEDWGDGRGREIDDVDDALGEHEKKQHGDTAPIARRYAQAIDDQRQVEHHGELRRDSSLHVK